MRSSKSRSRSKQNRPRTLGNIVNRVFDSSGPEGKVRGTPQQIIEKYLILARDAQLSNDRVAAENFMQHAEHYTRMLAEAQRELQAEQEARQQTWQQSGGNGQNGQPNGNGNGGQRDRDTRDRDGRDNREGRGDYRQDQRGDQPRADNRPSDLRAEEPAPSGVEVIDLSGEDEGGLVETPEARAPEPAVEPAAPAPQETRYEDRAPRAPRPPKDGQTDRPARPQQQRRQPKAAPDAAAPEVEPAPVAAAAEQEPKTRRPRGPRKPRGETPDGSGEGGPREAAE